MYVDINVGCKNFRGDYRPTKVRVNLLVEVWALFTGRKRRRVGLANPADLSTVTYLYHNSERLPRLPFLSKSVTVCILQDIEGVGQGDPGDVSGLIRICG